MANIKPVSDLRNYIFYRIENTKLRLIRVLDIRRDFIQILFGESVL